MQISFLSLDSEQNKVYFVSDATKTNSIYTFEDKSTEHTTIHLEVLEDKVCILRKGSVQMNMEFVEGHATKGTYEDVFGLTLEFTIYCEQLKIMDKKILIHYQMLQNNSVISTIKLALTFL